jgi:hypothetical protein
VQYFRSDLTLLIANNSRPTTLPLATLGDVFTALLAGHARRHLTTEGPLLNLRVLGGLGVESFCFP